MGGVGDRNEEETLTPIKMLNHVTILPVEMK